MPIGTSPELFFTMQAFVHIEICKRQLNFTEGFKQLPRKYRCVFTSVYFAKYLDYEPHVDHFNVVIQVSFSDAFVVSGNGLSSVRLGIFITKLQGNYILKCIKSMPSKGI